MKKHAICIQCHKNPGYINELVSLFPADHFDVFIHVDKKSAITPEILHSDNVYFVADENRVDVRWGQFSQVEATLALFALFEARDYHYVHLISGEDAPIKNPDEIFSALSDSHEEYIDSNALPENSPWAWGGIDRYSVNYPGWIIERPKNRVKRVLRVLYRELVMRTGIGKKTEFPFPKFYGGSSWFSITGECLQWIKEYVAAHTELLSFFEHGVCVDEIFFHTIIRYGPYAENVANGSTRFMIWNESKSGGPLVLREEHIPLMRESKNEFFARKVSDVKVMRAMMNELWDAGAK